jgi:hypothetical protein
MRLYRVLGASFIVTLPSLGRFKHSTNTKEFKKIHFLNSMQINFLGKCRPT